MRRSPLAPAFVTTVIASGCAWTYGVGAHYAHVGGSPNGAALGARGAWGLGGGRQTLTLAADLAMGASPSHGGFWVHSSPRLEYSWLPRVSSLGLRLGAGGLVASAARGGDLSAGPLLSSELLFALRTEDEEGHQRGYRATLLGLGVQLAYDLAGEANGPAVLVSLSFMQDGVLPFGNPPGPRVVGPEQRPAPTLQVATDPPR